MVTFVVFAFVLVVWLLERSSVRRRLATLEALVEELRRSAPVVAAAETGVAASSTASVVDGEPQTPEATPRVDSVELDGGDRATTATAVSKRVQSAIWTLLTSGRLMARLGGIILFIGVAFLLRYAAERDFISLEWRLTGVALGAAALLALGWRWRAERRNYALVLQGVGVGILYLLVFVTLRLYQLVTPGFAFGLLVAIAALSAVLAILQNSLVFAVLGAAGGFAAPLLVSTGYGSHVVLFSYYGLLDAAILAIAWFRAWRLLNLTAFLFTYVIGIVWGVLRYQPENIATTEPFLALFFLLFVAMSVLFAMRRVPTLLPYVDRTLVFGVPIITIGLQSVLVRHIPYALAYSAVALAAFYLVLAWQLRRLRREQLQFLVESHIALGVAFATLAIPYGLPGHWTAASWALEGAAIFWAGLRQNRRLPVAAGLVLQTMGGGSYLVSLMFWGDDTGNWWIANYRFVAAMVISLAGIASGLLWRRYSIAFSGRRAAALGGALWFWALGWFTLAGYLEIERNVADSWQPMAMLAWVASIAGFSSVLGARARWRLVRATALTVWPVAACFALAGIATGHPSAYGGWGAWPATFAAGYWVLYRDDPVATRPVADSLHVLAVWLGTYLLTAEMHWQLLEWVPESSAWGLAATGLLPSFVLFFLANDFLGRYWPRRDHVAAYHSFATLGLGAYLVAWNVFASVISDGLAAPIPYIPVLNPVDAAQAFSLLVVGEAIWRHQARESGAGFTFSRQGSYTLLGGGVFLWLNTLVFRFLHHRIGVAYELQALFDSTIVQTTLTIFWTVLAVATMAWAARAGRRMAWFSGASLLVVVVAKLFLVDLSHTATVSRIVSFVGVGILMLVIGYFAPVPPRERRAETV